MAQQSRSKRIGRPVLPERQKRQKVTLMLTPDEMACLRAEFAGHTVGFSVFCREKLLNREAVTLSRPLDGEVRRQLTNLLRFSGSVLLLAQKTRQDAAVSEDFRLMASQLRQVVQRAHYSVSEMTISQSLVYELYAVLLKTGPLVKTMRKGPDEGALRELAGLHGRMREILESHLARYQLKSPTHDR